MVYPFNEILFRKNEILIDAVTWMTFENLLNERSQTQKVTYCMILFI